MKRRTGKGTKDFGEGDSPNPLERRVFYQDLPPDIQIVVLQGVKFRLSKESLVEDLGLLEPDDLLDEDADDFINGNNIGRAIKDWIRFAETGR